MPETTVSIFSWHHPAIALGEALAAIHGSGWKNCSGDTLPIGLFYTPKKCLFGRTPSDGTIETPEDGGLNLAEVFEARVFNTDGELRWLRDPEGDGTGQAVFVAEKNNAPPDGWQNGKPLTCLTLVEDDYLLWGTTTGWNKKKNWLQLATPRIGGLYVPVPSTVPPGEKKRLQLQHREYIGLAPGAAGEHGNMAVVEERLLGVEELVAGKGENHAG